MLFRNAAVTYFSLLLTIVFFIGCGKFKKKNLANQPPLEGYELMHPQIYKLSAELNEISGICFNNGNPDSIYAQQDEDGKVYRFKLGNDSIVESKFSKKGDYEDMQILNGRIIVLKSNGELYTYALNEEGVKEIPDTKKFEGLLPKGEYEALYADSKENKLYVLCKHCNEKRSKTNSGYIFSVSADGNIQQAGDFSIDVKSITKKADKRQINFQPSAFAKNEITGEWFVVSSINKMVVVTDNAWQVKTVYELDPDLYNQPEGIAFDKEGTLYISNERGITSNATILKMVHNK